MKSWIVLAFVVASVPALWAAPQAPSSGISASSSPTSAPDANSPPALTPAPVLPFEAPATDRGAEATKLIVSGQGAAAEKIVLSELAANPQDPEWITLLAEIRIGQGRENDAVQLLARANQIAGVTALRAMLTGAAECIWNRTDLAEPEFRKAIELDPFRATPHYFLARLLYTEKRYDEAIQESKNAFSLDPNFVRAYENLGLCYEGKRDTQDAEHYYLEAMRVDSTQAKKTEWPALDLGSMLLRENRVDEAKPYLEQAVAINPNNAMAMEAIGTLRQRLGDKKGALEAFQASIKLDPLSETTYYRAATLSRELGETELAKQYLDKFREIHEQKNQFYTNTREASEPNNRALRPPQP